MLRDGDVPGLHAHDKGLVFVATRALQEAQRLGEEHERTLGDALRVLAGAGAKSLREYLGEGHSRRQRSEEHTSELQSLMRISDAVFCLKKKNKQTQTHSSLQPRLCT